MIEIYNPIEESLKFHLDDCAKWIKTWNDFIKISEKYPDSCKKELRHEQKSLKIIEEEIIEVLATCLYWHSICEVKNDSSLV